MDWQSIEKGGASVTAYLAHRTAIDQLALELGDILFRQDRLFVTREPQPSLWAQNIWHDARVVTIPSIKRAASLLRDIQRNWYGHPLHSFRRCELIQEQLPRIRTDRLAFPTTKPTQPLGSWTLLEDNTMLYAAHCSSPYPDGIMEFEENKSEPPNRAYLKLWEIFTRTGHMPRRGEKAMELGASPGGWTWVLAKLGCQVLALDRSELASNISAMKGVQFVSGDAFAQTPDSCEPIDWLFSDVICYPDKLFPFVEAWVNSDKCKNFVITIKLQGQEHYDWIPKFQSIEGSHTVHLYHNKHELTWYKFA